MDITTIDESAITNAKELTEAIEKLKQRKKEQQTALAAQFKLTYQGFMPANILKNTFNKFTEPGDMRNSVLKLIGGIGTGLLTKGLLGGKATSVVGSLFSKVLKTGAANIFYANAEKLKAYGTSIYHNLFKKK